MRRQRYAIGREFRWVGAACGGPLRDHKERIPRQTTKSFLGLTTSEAIMLPDATRSRQAVNRIALSIQTSRSRSAESSMYPSVTSPVS